MEGGTNEGRNIVPRDDVGIGELVTGEEIRDESYIVGLTRKIYTFSIIQ